MRNLDLLAGAVAPQTASRDYWTWGTIGDYSFANSAYKTSVTLDGESVPISDGVCDMTGSALRKGMRVRCHVQGNRVLITSALRGPTLAPVPGQTEANKRIAWGETFYRVDMDAIQVGRGISDFHLNFGPDEVLPSVAQRDLSITGAQRWPGRRVFIGGEGALNDSFEMHVWDGSEWKVFKAESDTGWVNIPLAGGFEAAETGPPQYRIVNNVVFLRGSVQQSATGELQVNTSPGHSIGTLPVEARPSGGDIYLVGLPQNPATHQVRLVIWTNGTVKVFLYNGTKDTDNGTANSFYVTLTGSYPLGAG